MSRPKLCIFDEPSLGLAPKIVDEVEQTIARIKAMGTTILLVEQNANMALAISDHGYVLESGRVSISGSAQELAGDARIQQAESFAGRIGEAIQPVFAPLGFDSQLTVGVMTSFMAREVFVSTMGVVYGVGADVDEESATLRERMKAERRADGRPVYTPLTGLSLLFFFALACQCVSTLAAIKRETAGWRWPLFTLAYMTALAWAVSFVTWQVGTALGA
jgi:ferrous iron transport protein B